MDATAVQAATRAAVISDCGKYRYHLARRFDAGDRRIATFIMLNPSTADAVIDDPTIRKVMGFARRWGCGELQVVNLFAYRATAPTDLRKADDPVGAGNRKWVCRAANESGLVVCAWGTHGAYMNQDLAVLGWLTALGVRPFALGLTRDGHPRHPLYVPYSAELVPFEGRQGGLRRCGSGRPSPGRAE
jgi:hypothetical protein